MKNLRLNFVELMPQSFDFTIYRRAYSQTNMSPDAFKYKLPLQEGEIGAYRDFSVTFKQMSDYNPFNCNSHTNHFLTIKMLFAALTEKVKSTCANSAFSTVDEKFHKRIDFIIERTPKGNKTISLIPYFLKSPGLFGLLINYKFVKLDGVPFDREVQRLSYSLDKEYRSNRNFYSDIHHTIVTFLQNYLRKLSPFKCDEHSLSILLDLKELKEERLEKKRYIFGNDGGNSQFQGVRQHGVLKPVKQPLIYVFIFEDRFKQFANELYLNLLGKANPGTFPGMEEMFSLNFSKADIRRIQLTDYAQTTILRIAEELKSIQNENKDKKIIGIFIEPTRDENARPADSPYFILKYYATLNAIPVQFIRYDKMNSSYSLKWSTSNIGLQIFAKCGGIPWKLKPTNENCLILGIGSAHEKDINGKIKKYFAYTVCLDSSGIYNRLEILAEDKDHDSYITNFENKLLQLIADGQNCNYTKCALHLPFKIKKREIKSIRNVIQQIRNIDFKVIKINTEHKFFGFGDHNTLVPYESSFVKLASREYLVWFDGLKYGKENVYQKIGNPVHIEFLQTDENSDNINTDLYYLQDVINLSGANWRGFNSKQVPISIYYSKILANYAKAFKYFSDFDESIFKNSLPWFL